MLINGMKINASVIRSLFFVALGIFGNCQAQGIFIFRNRFPPENIAPVFDTDCRTPLAGSAFLAQAYVGLSQDVLHPLEPIAEFSTGGFLARAYTVPVPGIVYQQVYVQMRVW